jgi:hypothetical protein
MFLTAKIQGNVIFGLFIAEPMQLTALSAIPNAGELVYC